MTKYFHRFRSIDALLDGRHELENQEIFFASPAQLNDPREGVRDVFWLGDRVVWKNLHRHYLKCLTRLVQIWCAGGGQHEVDWRHVPLFDPILPAAATPEFVDLDAKIEAAFFTPEAEAYVSALAARTSPVRREELRSHIQGLNPLAIATIVGCHEKSGIAIMKPGAVPTAEKFELFASCFKISMELIKHAESVPKTPEAQRALSAMFQATASVRSQMTFINQYNGALDVSMPGKSFVFVDFPVGYVDKLDSILHPAWYAACFMTDSEDAALWAYYGDNHRGACLIFKADGSDERPTLNLQRLAGVGPAGAEVGTKGHEFLPVTYSNESTQVDFFRSFGLIPIPTLNRVWYFDPVDGHSSCSREMHDDVDAWRGRYWKTFELGATTKMEDWKAEDEHRLLLHSSLIDFSDPSTRKLKYDFQSLAGIVFGDKTVAADRIRISKIIEAKCRALGRTDFKFYEATVSVATGKIVHRELSLLKFGSTEAT